MDDYAGAIYRVQWGETESRPRPAELLREIAAAGSTAPTPTVDRARGAALYERFECASCHEKTRAEPWAVVVPLAGLSERFGVEELANFLETPTPPMPVFPLDATERRDLAGYLLESL